MEVLDRAKEMERAGTQVIHLEVGEPDFDTPQVIQEAAIRALKDGRTRYTHSMGLPELREAISEHYWRQYQARISPDQVLVTSGSSPAMQLAFSALLEAGDEVILPDPGYACYSNMVGFQEAVPVAVGIFEESGYQMDPGAIAAKISPRTKGIIINSPANPTGVLLEPGRMREIARLGPMILSDEIYHGLVYGTKAHSILEFTERAFVFNGFSKLYAMTGWRLGYVIFPREFGRAIKNLQQNFFISANAFVQWAGVAALREAADEIAAIVATYDARRRLMLDGLKKLGFQIRYDPQGAFYVFANAAAIHRNSLELAMDILEKVHVGVAPGIDFGKNGEGHLRFSYANSPESIEEGLERLKRYLERAPK
jgi:aspartate/methionine/tyrosine aminotransferase